MVFKLEPISLVYFLLKMNYLKKNWHILLMKELGFSAVNILRHGLVRMYCLNDIFSNSNVMCFNYDIDFFNFKYLIGKKHKI